MSKARLTAGKCEWFNSELTVLILLRLKELGERPRRLNGVVGVEAPELENPPVAKIWLVQAPQVVELELENGGGIECCFCSGLTNQKGRHYHLHGKKDTHFG